MGRCIQRIYGWIYLWHYFDDFDSAASYSFPDKFLRIEIFYFLKKIKNEKNNKK
jgi:hypothetical protein